LAGVPQRVGYATDGRWWMLTNAVTPAAGRRHQMHYYLDLVRVMAASAIQPSIENQATLEERNGARDLLPREGVSEGAPFVVLNAGAAYGAAKRWHEDRFAGVADILANELGLHVALIGSGAEMSIADAIRTRMKTRTAVLNGKTSLEILIGVLAESSL